MRRGLAILVLAALLSVTLCGHAGAWDEDWSLQPGQQSAQGV